MPPGRFDPAPRPPRNEVFLVKPLSVVEKAARQADLVQRRLASCAARTALGPGAGPIGLLGTLFRARGFDVVTVARRPAPNPAAAIVDAAGARYVATGETSLPDLAAGLPPLDLVFEATGVAPLAFAAMDVLGSNGVLVLLSLTGGDHVAPLPVDRLNPEFALGSKVLVGSVNSAHEEFSAGVADLARFARLWPGLTPQPITHRLDGFADAPRLAAEIDEGIKAVIEFGT